MNVVFRVDASTQMGTGHVMRCITLANALKDNGAKVTFVARTMPETLSTIIVDNGFQLRMLNYRFSDDFDELPHASWLGVSQQVDAHATIQAISNIGVNLIIVDHYGMDFRWHQKLKPYTENIMVIDDLADRVHDCDVLLDQNYYMNMERRYIHKVPLNCNLLLGPKYAILREEFKLKREQAKIRSTPVKNILVNFGGCDPDNYTKKTIEVLAAISDIEFEVNVVIGALHPDKESIKCFCDKNSFHFFVQTNQMAELILKADMAIGAGGATTWERCALGLPTIVLPVASNQFQLVKDAAFAGLVYYAELESNNTKYIECHIRALIANSALRTSISKKSLELINTSGVSRVMYKLNLQEDIGKLHVREVGFHDASLTWKWRNHPLTRRHFFDDSETKQEDHVKWWSESLENEQRTILLGLVGDEPIGVVRFDIENKFSARISIYLNPEIIGKGFGKPLMLEAEKWFLKKYDFIKKFTAEVKVENRISEGMFLSCGFNKDYLVLSKVTSHE